MTREEIIEQLNLAIDLIKQDGKDWLDDRDIPMLEECVKALSQEPCEKCKYFDGNSCQHYDYKVGYTQGYEDASNRFRQEPCDDAISRDAAIEAVSEGCQEWRGIYGRCEELINALPSVTHKSGKWIEHPEIETTTPEYLMFYECSECGDKPCFCKSDIHKKRFCSNCGAKMVEPQESEEKE